MPDIDLDLADRSKILEQIRHISAAIIDNKVIKKHTTGIYCQDIPYNALTNTANIDYQIAETRGYFKLDFLNVTLYNQVRNEQHLDQLLAREPDWASLYNNEFCNKKIHIGNHYNTLVSMPEAVTSIERMAMFLAIIRPAKRHLIGKTWNEVAKTIWSKPENGGYYFKKAHAIGYSHLVVLHMNLLVELQHTSN